MTRSSRRISRGVGTIAISAFGAIGACYADVMGLALLEDWLADADSRAEWNLRLAASCVLRASGVSRIRLKDILLTVQQFTMMTRLLGIPSRSFHVAPLQAGTLAALAMQSAGRLRGGRLVELRQFQRGQLWEICRVGGRACQGRGA